MDYNNNYNNNFIPSFLKKINKDGNNISDSNNIFKNESNILIEEKDINNNNINNKKIYLKNQLSVINYFSCPKISNLLSLKYSVYSDSNKNPRDFIGSALFVTNYGDNNFNGLLIQLQNIWQPFLSKSGDNYILNEDKSYLKMNIGYLALCINEDLYYSSNIQRNNFLKTGYSYEFRLNFNGYNDNNDILTKLRVTDVNGNFQYLTLAQQNSILSKLGFSSSLYSSYVSHIYKFSLDGNYSWWSLNEEGGGYDIKFFSEQIYENTSYINGTLEINKTLLDVNLDKEESITIPVRLEIKNQLIYILTDYENQYDNIASYVCYLDKNTNWYGEFQVWCPDQSYLSYILNTVDISVEEDTTDSKTWKSFAYHKFTFSISDKKNGDTFYITYIFTYSQGDLYYKKTYALKITVRKLSYSITYNLTGVTSSNTSSNGSYYSHYSTTLTPNSGKTITSVIVTSDGNTIHNGINNGLSGTLDFYITGDIVITAIAS